jgi:hypothetical protein
VCFQCFDHHVQHSIRMQQDIVVPEAQYAISQRRQIIGSLDVFIRVINVLTTVCFNDQFCFNANEVSDVASDGMLATKFMAEQFPVAQMTPK